MARPITPSPYLKFTEENRKIILDALRDGFPKSRAALLAGVSIDRFFDWLREGKTNPEAFPEKAKFAEEVELAVVEGQKVLSDRIRQTALSGAPNTWQAAAWVLERTAPEEWGRRDKVEVEGGEKPLIQLNQVVLGNEETRQISRDLLRRVGVSNPHKSVGPGTGDEPSEDDLPEVVDP